jgi:hypothetical protein
VSAIADTALSSDAVGGTGDPALDVDDLDVEQEAPTDGAAAAIDLDLDGDAGDGSEVAPLSDEDQAVKRVADRARAESKARSASEMRVYRVDPATLRPPVADCKLCGGPMRVGTEAHVPGGLFCRSRQRGIEVDESSDSKPAISGRSGGRQRVLTEEKLSEHLREHGPATVRRLAEDLGISKSAVTNVIGPMRRSERLVLVAKEGRADILGLPGQTLKDKKPAAVQAEPESDSPPALEPEAEQGDPGGGEVSEPPAESVMEEPEEAPDAPAAPVADVAPMPDPEPAREPDPEPEPEPMVAEEEVAEQGETEVSLGEVTATTVPRETMVVPVAPRREPPRSAPFECCGATASIDGTRAHFDDCPYALSMVPAPPMVVRHGMPSSRSFEMLSYRQVAATNPPPPDASVATRAAYYQMALEAITEVLREAYTEEGKMARAIAIRGLRGGGV